MFKVGKSLVIFLFVLFICNIAFAVTSSQINEATTTLHERVKQINSFIDYVHLDKAKTEDSLNYERDKLLGYIDYINNEIYRLELDLHKLDRLLDFVDERYQANKYSNFINDSVKANEKFNTRLKDYTKSRVLILNDLILAKDTDINIEYALDDISRYRNKLRNDFKFNQSTVLWQPNSWTHAIKTISSNFVNLVLDIIVFTFTVLFFLFFRRVLSIKSVILKNKELRHKKNLYWAAFKFEKLYDLILGIAIYPLVIVLLVSISIYFGLINRDAFYSVMTSLQIIALYCFFIYILSVYARVIVSFKTETYLLIYCMLFGVSMHFFLSSLVDFSPASVELTQFIGDALIPGFIMMLFMLIPAIMFFYSLGKEQYLDNYEPKRFVTYIVRYFVVVSLVFCIIMMILGGYPNLGMSVSFDLYQTFFWAAHIYVFYKVVIVLLDLVFCKKTKMAILRRTAENVMGDIKRTGFRYWVKSFVIVVATILFIVFTLLSFNVLPQKLYDVWEIFFYEGETLLGVDILPLQSFLESLSVLVVMFISAKIVMLFAEKRIYPYTNWDLGTKEATTSIIKYIFIITAIFLFIKSLGISNTTIAFIASGLSVGLGFAMQDLVKNFFAGLVMLIERPVKIGDWVNVENEIGVVKRISIRATEVLTFNNNSLIIPNNVMITNIVSNETLDRTSRLVIDIKVAYRHDPEEVMDICRRVVTSEKRIFFTPPPEFILLELGDSAMTVSVRAYCLRIHNFDISSDLRMMFLKALKENNIEIQPSKMDVRIKNLENDNSREIPKN
ncbi:mechanosensitive ion channel family protein [Francisella adeliensis]|uniref:Mechanosensitive ion channel n=1 Tax=Francisella adeliensis TaxID=2007306 RepID=A0A2Z4XVT5_9GAMM|nr:mechanosensitive ion channel domain-containing protein [Francisella adeliensis]AXA32937.1 hypothetical protein CDH04_00235 [Francisella adeliensis]MBK2086183.1 mechanosensitive ion channel [Francisella adeliensis]MBK2096653.1 mechanosensitive ion channel [Francisella adeliensis]QIW11163.1 mechanosensitive ion channel [Francisella adeliensis]QIW13039.1 mechanosensitive ion channel [Francisella adeliensis]